MGEMLNNRIRGCLGQLKHNAEDDKSLRDDTHDVIELVQDMHGEIKNLEELVDSYEVFASDNTNSKVKTHYRQWLKQQGWEGN